MDTYLTIKNCLEKIHRFSDSQVSLFYNLLKKKTLRKKACLLKKGQVCQFVTIILSGSARIYDPENEQTLGFFVEGDWVADHQSFVNQAPSANVIETVEDAEVAVITIGDIHYLIEKDPAFIVLGRVLSGFITPLHFAKYNTPPQNRYNELMQKHPEWIIRFPQKHLASYLGMAPETFSRMKRKTLFS